MNKFLFIFFLLMILTVSCAEKHEKVMAIDILLTLPEDIYQKSIQLNQAILENNSDNFMLDERHIPHVTLLQCYVQEEDLPTIENLLIGLYNNIKNDILYAHELQYSKDKIESFASIGIKPSESLMSLHEKVIALIQPYIITDGSQKSYVQNSDGTPIDGFTIAYVPKFVSDHSFENYNPHISLGVAKTSILDSLAQHNFHPLEFRATSISIYQLGSFGTAQKQIWKSE